MTSATRSLLLAAVSALALLGVVIESPPAAADGGEMASAPGHTTPQRQRDESAGDARVLMVSVPRLTWERLEAVDTPDIDRFLQTAAIASTSTRTVGSRTSPGDAYLTIGAGARATSGGLDDVGAVMSDSEATDDGSAAEIYERRFGVSPDGKLLGLAFAQIQRRNDELLYGAKPGSLGGVLRDAGQQAGAIANADEDFGSLPRRQAALAVLDDRGQAPLGDVRPDLLVADPMAPGGVRMDSKAVLAATDRALSADARLLLVEMSDLERAEQSRPVSTVAVGDQHYDDALRSADELFGGLLERMDPDSDLVVLVAPTAPLEGEELTVFAIGGPGTETGWARSATTRRDGYVTLTDLAATVLDFLGVQPNEDIGDTAVTTTTDDAPWSQRVDAMVAANDRAVFRDDAVGPLTVSFIAVLVAMLVLVALGMALGRDWDPQITYLVLLVMAIPTATYLGGLLPYGPFTVFTYGLALLAIAGVIAAVALPLARWDREAAPVLVAGITVAVLAVDILTGGHLQIDTIFGYSPIVAGRFAGFGNQAFSLISVSMLLVASGGWALWTRRSGVPKRWRLAVVLSGFALVMVLVGMPTLGSDVGGVLASVPAFTLCTLLLLGRPIRTRTVLTIAFATVAMLAVFATLDLLRPESSRTHLGRFAERVLDGGGALVLERKLDANISVLTSTVWTWVIPAALLFFVYLTWRPNSVLRQVNAAHATFRAFGISAITLGLTAGALNDSGVSMPAMMLAVALPYTAILVLEVRDKPARGPR